MAEPSLPESPIRILVADDQPDVRRALRLLLEADRFEVAEAASPEEVLGLLSGRSFDVALLDLNYARNTTSGREGLDLLRRLRGQDACLCVVVMTAWSSVPSAVEAMRLGAQDYVEKPWDNERLLTTLRTHAALTRTLRSDRSAGETRRAGCGCARGAPELGCRTAPQGGSGHPAKEHARCRCGPAVVAARSLRRVSGRGTSANRTSPPAPSFSHSRVGGMGSP